MESFNVYLLRGKKKEKEEIFASSHKEKKKKLVQVGW